MHSQMPGHIDTLHQYTYIYKAHGGSCRNIASAMSGRHSLFKFSHYRQACLCSFVADIKHWRKKL